MEQMSYQQAIANGFKWVGGVDGYWQSPGGSIAGGKSFANPPQFTPQQYWDDAVKRDARAAARRLASKTVTPAVRKSIWSRVMGMLGKGAKLTSVIGVIDMFASKAGAEEIDWDEYYAEPKVTGGPSEEDLAIQAGIEAGTHDASGKEILPMGPFQDVNMYRESYLREQFYGF